MSEGLGVLVLLLAERTQGRGGLTSAVAEVLIQGENPLEVGLTWHNPNLLVLVEDPEIAIQPVGIRRLPPEVA